jgi:hypothetical protein
MARRKKWYYIFTFGNVDANMIVSTLLDADTQFGQRKVPFGRVKGVWECEIAEREMLRSMAKRYGYKIRVYQGYRTGTLWHWYPEKEKKNLRLVRSAA